MLFDKSIFFKTKSMHHQLEKHYVNRVGWLRAAVLGANDGLLSTTSIVIGVAAASPDRNTIILAALAGMIAGAMSMAAGEYVSVSSQEDTEKADLAREQRELEEMPEIELQELAKIYEKRGVSKETALQVAAELTAHDALAAHAHDELWALMKSHRQNLCRRRWLRLPHLVWEHYFRLPFRFWHRLNKWSISSMDFPLCF